MQLQALETYNPEFHKNHADLIGKGRALHHNLVSVIATVCILKTLTCKRFKKAVSNKTAPPKDLCAGLSATMNMAKDQGLTIPPGLQARSAKFTAGH